METLRDAENQIDKIHSISAIETVNISYLIYRKGKFIQSQSFNIFITKPIELFLLIFNLGKWHK